MCVHQRTGRLQSTVPCLGMLGQRAALIVLQPGAGTAAAADAAADAAAAAAAAHRDWQAPHLRRDVRCA